MLWTPADFADYAQLSIEQVSKLRQNGQGPAFTKIGKHIRYLPINCHRWILDNQQTSTRESTR